MSYSITHSDLDYTEDQEVIEGGGTSSSLNRVNNQILDNCKDNNSNIQNLSQRLINEIDNPSQTSSVEYYRDNGSNLNKLQELTEKTYSAQMFFNSPLGNIPSFSFGQERKIEILESPRVSLASFTLNGWKRFIIPTTSPKSIDNLFFENTPSNIIGFLDMSYTSGSSDGCKIEIIKVNGDTYTNEYNQILPITNNELELVLNDVDNKYSDLIMKDIFKGSGGRQQMALFDIPQNGDNLLIAIKLTGPVNTFDISLTTVAIMV